MTDKITSALQQMKTNKGVLLQEHSFNQPVLIVFLRPFGCIFCMEAMQDLSNQRDYIESSGVEICCVHMATASVAEQYFEEYGLNLISHVSDPNCSIYESFGLLKGNFNQLYGLKVWMRTAQLAIQDLRRLRMKQIGDGFQMPGVFLVYKGQVVSQYIHSKTSDRPDYKNIIGSISPQ